MPRSDTLPPAECAGKIAAAKRVAVLTGAGISTAAGVPDFRGPKGLYVTRAYDPETVFEIGYFDRDPEPFYRFSRDFLALLSGIEPTFTHRFLAKLEKEGKDICVITQNIDGLHQKAGSRNVLPVHGDYKTAHCRRSSHGCDGGGLREMMRRNTVPICPRCGGVMKPDVVFFGENVRHLVEADAAARRSDLMLVLGSSLQVYPAAALPDGAGGEIVVVNLGKTGMRPNRRTHVVDAGLDEYFTEVDGALQQ